jgi:hypothetical protein
MAQRAFDPAKSEEKSGELQAKGGGYRSKDDS